MDPMRFLRSRDPLERNLMLAIARDARVLQRKDDDERATQISNAIMKGLGG
jgi:hypothetical protein